MYYSYHRAEKDGILYDFIAEPRRSDDYTQDDIDKINELLLRSHYLGEVNGRRYYYVPDDMPLVEQPPEIEAQALTELPEDVHEELLLNGDYAKELRLVRGIKKQHFTADYRYCDDFALLYNYIIDLATVQKAMLASSYTTLARSRKAGDDGVPLHATHSLDKLSQLNDDLQSDLNKVGL